MDLINGCKKIIFLGFLLAFGKPALNAMSLCDSIVNVVDTVKHISVKKKFKNGFPCGNWSYFSNSTFKIIKKEFYKKGVLQYTYFYNERGQVIESTDKKGKVKTYEPCNCKG